MNFEKYKNKMTYPVKPKKPVLKGNIPQDYRDHASALEAYEKEMILYNEEVNRWKNNESLILSTFVNDLFEELDIKDNPKKNLLYNIAWDKGHASGLEEVFVIAEELVDLIR